MELLNVLVVVLAALGSALAQQGPSDYQEAVDNTLAIVQRSSDWTIEVGQDAIAKIEDIRNSLSLATGEARFALIHVANFANLNNLTALEETLPSNPSDRCIANDVPAIKMITKETALAMVECFKDKSGEVNDIHKDTLALNDQAAAIMPKAVERIGKCSESNDINCVETEMKEILQGSATIEHELQQNVMRAEESLGSMQSDITLCLGQLTAMFVTEVGKYGSKMVSCIVNDN